jgi:tetratricopeptide (TPR) repeat protein
MSSSSNPFHLSDAQYKQFEEAWRLKSTGAVQSAAEIFEALRGECALGSLEYIKVLHPLAVCYRVAREFVKADETSQEAYDLALTSYPDTAHLILLDRSVLLLDQKRPREAVEMLEKAMEHLHSDDRLQRAKAEAYLGRAQGRVRGRRREALGHNQQAADELRYRLGFEDMHLDNLIWMLELWLWSPRARLACFLEAWRLANKLGYPWRKLDALATFMGGRPAREALRRLARLAAHFKR